MDFPNVTGFSERNLWRMKAFYEKYKSLTILPLMVAELPWTHNYILLEKIKDNGERLWYAEECLKNSWSKTILIHQIELNLYSRKKLAHKMTNFKEQIVIKNNVNLAQEMIKDSYIFELEGLKENFIEKELEERMVEKVKTVLLKLGKGFSFVGNQYRISTDNNEYFLDLLFYHLDLRCYIVVELKNTEFKPIGQLGFYVKAVDNTLKKEMDNQTIGLLLCKEKDKLSVEWALDMINAPIGIASYELNKYIPKDILEKLPTEEDLNLHIDIKE